MSNKKVIRVAKAAGEWCTIGTGIAGIVLGVVASVLALPIVLTVIVAAGIGLLCAIIGGRNEVQKIAKQEKAKAAKTVIETEQRLELLEIKEDLDVLRENAVAHREAPAIAILEAPASASLAPLSVVAVASAPQAQASQLSLFAPQKGEGACLQEPPAACNDAIFKETPSTPSLTPSHGVN
jgi:hypothetical protein